MSVVDEFRQHPIHSRLKGLGQAIESLTDERRAEAEGKIPGFLDRSTEVIGYLVERLELTDPRLLTPARLGSASHADAQLNTALAAIAGTAGTPVEDWPVQVDTALTTALDHLTVWPALPPASDERATRLTEVAIVQLQEKHAAAQAEADRMAARLEQLQADLDTAAKRTSESISSASKEVQRLLSEASAAITAKQEEASDAANAAVTQVQTSANAELQQLRDQNGAVLSELKEAVTAQQAETKQQADATLTELKTAVTAERTRIANTLTQLQEQFSTAQEERRREASEQKTQIEKEASALQSAIKQAADDDRSHTKAAADAGLAELDSLLGSARDLVGTIAATGTSGVYGKEAVAQQKQANTWRGYAVALGIVTGLVALFAVLGDSKVFTVSITSSAKLVAALAFGSLATYCGRQASRHRMREERARRLELELSAFPPFLAKLEEPEQREVVREYFQKVFVGYNDGGPPIQASDDQIGIARQVASSVTARAKKQGAST